MSAALSLLAALALAWALPAQAWPQTAPRRTWEVNGIRLEADQVERLAADMADRTVAAVEKNVEGLELREDQRPAMRDVFLDVSLDVYDRVVREVARDDIDDEGKEERVRELVLAGQRKSHERLRDVLDAQQMALYSAWEEAQVAAFRSRRWDRRDRRRRR